MIDRTTARSILSLGWPIFISQLAIMANGIVDTAMAGNLSAQDLAAMAIGSSVYFVVYVGLMGALQAIPPMAAQHLGGDRLKAVGETWRQGQWMALALMIPGLVALAWPQPLLSLARADADVNAQATAYLNLVALGLPAALWFRAFTIFNASVSRPRVVMLINLLGPILKVPLNLLFMHGSRAPEVLGLPALPALGGAGCGLSTAVLAWTSALIGWTMLHRDPFYRRFSMLGLGRPDRRTLMELMRLGLPIGATYLIDVSAFNLMTLLVARLGTAIVGGHAIAANLAAVIFMLPMALGNATSVLAAQQLGANNPAGARQAAWTGIRLAGLLALVVCALLLLVRGPLAAAYTRDPAVAAVAVSLLALVAFYHLFDAMQCVLAMVLRAWKIAIAPMLIFAVSLWGVGVGGGWWLAFRHDMGVTGFWVAAGASVACASLALLWLFERQTRPRRKRDSGVG